MRPTGELGGFSQLCFVIAVFPNCPTLLCGVVGGGNCGQQKVPAWCHPLGVPSLGLMGTASGMLLSLQRNPRLLLEKWLSCFLQYLDLSRTAGQCVLSQGCLGGTRAEAPWMGMSRGCPIHPAELCLWSHCTATLAISAASSPLLSSSHLVHPSPSPITLLPLLCCLPWPRTVSFLLQKHSLFPWSVHQRLGGSQAGGGKGFCFGH